LQSSERRVKREEEEGNGGEDGKEKVKGRSLGAREV